MTVNTETHRESVAVECLALNEDSYITPLLETQGTSHKGRGQKYGKSQRLGRTVGKQCLLDVSHDLTAAMVGSGVGFCGEPDYSDHRLFLRINLIASRCSSGQHLQNQPFTDVSSSQGHASVWRWRFSNRRLWLAESCHSQSYSEEATWSKEHACMYACCSVCTQAHAHEHRDHRRTLRFPFCILPPYSS